MENGENPFSDLYVSHVWARNTSQIKGGLPQSSVAPSWSGGMYLLASIKWSATSSGVSTLGLRVLMTPIKATWFDLLACVRLPSLRYIKHERVPVWHRRHLCGYAVQSFYIFPHDPSQKRAGSRNIPRWFGTGTAVACDNRHLASARNRNRRQDMCVGQCWFVLRGWSGQGPCVYLSKILYRPQCAIIRTGWLTRWTSREARRLSKDS